MNFKGDNMSLIYVCDFCGAHGDEDIDVYEIRKDVKDYIGSYIYDYICSECFEDLNEDNDLCIVKGVVKIKKTKAKE